MFKAGYVEGMAADPVRQAWRADDPRPLAWAAWYPASEDAELTDKFLGPPGHALFHMGKVAEGAALSSDKGRWPVVLVSHGTGGVAQNLGWLGAALAAQGFVVIGVSHHGNTAAEPYLPEGFLCWWERARDLSVILDILSKQGLFAGRLDEENSFACGFSLGGYSALQLAGALTSIGLFEDWAQSAGSGDHAPREFPRLREEIADLKASSSTYRASVARHAASFRDSRIRAVVALAPAPPIRSFVPQSLADIALPVLIAGGRKDREAPHEICALWLKQQNSAFQLALLEGDAGHSVYFPVATEFGALAAPEICLDPAGVDRAAIHRTTAAMAARLFRDAMQGD